LSCIDTKSLSLRLEKKKEQNEEDNVEDISSDDDDEYHRPNLPPPPQRPVSLRLPNQSALIMVHDQAGKRRFPSNVDAWEMKVD